MLSELRIENLAVIPVAELKLSEGLNVITGETGAGKTILAHAISLLLGARADSSLIRPGAEAASVEAVFRVPDGCFADLAGEIDVPEGEDLAIRRRLARDGRSRAWVGGRSVSLSVLGQLAGRLLAFSAQHEQRRLMMASRQMEILDAYGGGKLQKALSGYRQAFRRLSELEQQLAKLDDGDGTRARETELLEFQAAEIAAAALAPGEDEELTREQKLLAGAQEMKAATAALAAELGAAGTGGELMEELARSLAQLEALAGLDPALDEISERLRGACFELEEVGRGARDYAEGIRHDPERLAEVEERLGLIASLKRKYGASIEEINRFGQEAQSRLEAMAAAGRDRSALEEELAGAQKEASALASRLSEARRQAAARLQKEATGHLRELAFNRCDFEVRLAAAGGGEEGAFGISSLGPAGADSVEFFVCLNPGMPATPLRETASGGELSRIMLAIKSAAAGSGETATLVFDEIDAGIGGETGAAVGAKLKGLAAGSQIICITHLPQIACFADAHFSVTKSVDGESGTATSVVRLKEGDVVDELCRMMGSAPDDSSARAHAGSLLKKARPA